MATGRYRLMRRASRLVAAMALAGFLAGSLGVPVLVPPDADGGPYPCRGHRCGCTSAQQCWFSCCCMTHQEKLLWARRHGVQPPPGVVQLAQKEAELARKVPHSGGHCGCCRPTASTSLCSSTERGGCCGKPQGSVPAGSQPTLNQPTANQWSIVWVCAISARRCYGQAQQWMALGSVAPPPACFQLRLDMAVCPLFAGPATSWSGVSWAPQPPPPRA